MKRENQKAEADFGALRKQSAHAYNERKIIYMYENSNTIRKVEKTGNTKGNYNFERAEILQ